MTGLNLVQSVQFVTVKGERLAVLSANDWEALMEWLETLEDLQLTKTAYAVLEAENGDRKRAGWLKWDEVEQELA
jgi:PHD/YefM family antitoxin component YafN of YafNO toxin-antitoxin module